MIEALGLKLVEAVLSFVVTLGLDSYVGAPPKGLPRWYSQPVKAHLCESATAPGEMPAALDAAVADARARLARRLAQAAEAAAGAQIKQARDDGERALVNSFRRDDGVGAFVNRSAARRDVEYGGGAPRSAYVRECIAERDIEAYQRARIETLVRDISRHRGAQADRELDEALRELEQR